MLIFYVVRRFDALDYFWIGKSENEFDSNSSHKSGDLTVDDGTS